MKTTTRHPDSIDAFISDLAEFNFTIQDWDCSNDSLAWFLRWGYGYTSRPTPEETNAR